MSSLTISTFLPVELGLVDNGVVFYEPKLDQSIIDKLSLE
jgi:hypothetical protein